MQFNKLSIKDKSTFDRFLFKENHTLSTYAFENIFIWKALYDIFWKIIDKNLCIFFKDKVGCFLYLPPLGKKADSSPVRECFKIMNKYNKNPIISRIENLGQGDADFYKNVGYEVVLGGREYICDRKELINLKGNYFKKKRNLINYFTNNYNFKSRPYLDKDRRGCLYLFKLWQQDRKCKNKDTIYQKLLDDNFLIFEKTLSNYNKLNFLGMVIEIDNEIKAMTFSYPLSTKSCVILFEVCDLKFKGIAQYIFREFCRQLNFKDINIMDDSGLDNLRKAKLSYKPYKLESSFIVRNG